MSFLSCFSSNILLPLSDVAKAEPDNLGNEIQNFSAFIERVVFQEVTGKFSHKVTFRTELHLKI